MIIEWNVLFVEKIFFVTSPMGLTDFRSTACKHYRKWDVTYRYRHIELMWCLSMVQYPQNNVIMKWTTRFTSFNGWIPLKYGSTITPSIIAHGQNLLCQTSNFTLRPPKTSNIRRIPSFDLLPDKFSVASLTVVRYMYVCSSPWALGVLNTVSHSVQFACLGPLELTDLNLIHHEISYFIVPGKLSWFIRHLSDGLYIPVFYSNLWNLSSDIWA